MPWDGFIPKEAELEGLAKRLDKNELLYIFFNVVGKPGNITKKEIYLVDLDM